MSDVGRDGFGTADEDRLPWLEPVDEDPVEEGVSAGRLIAGLVVALIVLGLVVGGIYWLRQRAVGGAGGPVPTEIAAQPGPYKVKPAEPGGMQPKGQGDSSYAASEGADVNGQIDLSATPETPIQKSKPAPAPAPVQHAKAPAPAPVQAAKAPAPAAKPATQVAQAPAKPAATPPVPAAKPQPAPAAAAPAAGGAQVQLGAFSSQAKAEAAWKSLSGRFAYMAPLGHAITPSEVGGKTVYRLRAAAGGQAGTVCSKLKVAGETCLVIG